MAKARVEMNFYPEDRENYDIVETAIEVRDDSDVGEMFDIWKRQMSALGYFMDDYEIVREEEVGITGEFLNLSLDGLHGLQRLLRDIENGNMPMDNPMPPEENM